MLKLALLTHEYGELRFGGAATYMEELLKVLTTTNILDIILVRGSRKSYVAKHPRYVEYAIHYPNIPPRHLWFQTILKNSNILKILYRCDIVHGNDTSIAFLLKDLVSRGTKCVATIHSYPLAFLAFKRVSNIQCKVFEIGELPLHLSMFRNVLQLSTKVVFVAEHLMRDWIDTCELLGIDKVDLRSRSEVIYVPLTYAFDHIHTEEHRYYSNAFIELAFVGRLFTIKGAQLIPWIVHKILRDYDLKVKMHVFGSGPLIAHIKNLAFRLGIAKNIVFHGYVPRHTMLRYLRQCWVLLMPSFYEACPYALIEANALGLPVVVFDLPWSREFVHDNINGFRARFLDLEDFASKVVKAIENVCSLSYSARKFVYENFNPYRILRRLVAMYESLSSSQ